MQYQRNWVAVSVLTFCVQSCSIEGNSIMDELELPTFGGDSGAGDQSLEVPPELDPPESKGEYDITSARESASDTGANRILPRYIDIRLRSEGNLSWLAVGATPDGLWSHLIGFWNSHGFDITDESMLRGLIETGWREQRLNVADGLRVRDMFRMRVERAPNAVTNVYLVNRKATFSDGDWQLAFSDRETEIDILYDLMDYLASRRGIEVKLVPLEHTRITLDIKNLGGVPVLDVGQPYSRVWRRLGATLDRAGLSVRRADRSRGVYLIRYRRARADEQFADAGGNAAGSQLLQVRLLSQGDITAVTVHPNRKRSAALAYETAHEVLHRIVLAYGARS